jgi:hypothetical protein
VADYFSALLGHPATVSLAFNLRLNDQLPTESLDVPGQGRKDYPCRVPLQARDLSLGAAPRPAKVGLGEAYGLAELAKAHDELLL